jgi:phage gp36-like protein
MAYAQQSDLCPLRMTQAELTQLTDDDNSGEIDTDVVNAALEEASGRVDAYCRQRYVTPLQQSDSVTSLVLDIATYLLFSRRRSFKMAETVRQRYEDAIAFLKDVASGKASLDQPGTVQTPQTSSGGPQRANIRKIFGEKEIDGFV